MKITLTDAGKRFNRDWIFRHFHYEFITSISYAITGPNGSGKSTLLQAIAGAIGISEGRIDYAVEGLGGRGGFADGGGMTGGVSSGVGAGGVGQVDGGSSGGEMGRNERVGSVDRGGRADRGTGEDNGVKIAGGGSKGHVIAPEDVYKHLSIAAPYLEVIEEMTAAELLQFHASFKPFLPGWTVKDILLKVGLRDAADKQIRYYSSGMRQRVRLAQAIFSNTALILLDEPCTNLDVDGIALYRQLVEDHCKGRMVIVSSNDVQEYDFCEKIINIMDHKSANGPK